MLRKLLTDADFMVTFILCDKSKSLVENGLTVRYFHRTKEQLPDIQGLDDVVILRNVKVLLHFHRYTEFLSEYAIGE